MKDLLVLLGKRVHELRVAKKWSQEEFAHVSGLHRTYIGQIERGEKNISFGNLVKVSGVLGVSMSELLAGIEQGPDREQESTSLPTRGARIAQSAPRMLDVEKLLRQLRFQNVAMDKTMTLLEKLTVGDRGQQSADGSSRKPNSKKK